MAQFSERQIGAAATTDPMLPRLYRVERVRRDLPDTVTMELRPADDGGNPPFAPGQFNMLYVPGVGEIPISISGDPTKPRSLIHTTRAVGAVSQAICALKAGDTLGVRGPYGAPWPVELAHGKDLVIVAGGIGLAPLRPALYAALAARERFGRVSLLYGARTPREMLFRRELERWRARLDLEVAVTVDRGTADWHGAVGVVTRLIPRVPFDPVNAVALVCGPEIMMRFTAAELEKRGLAPEHIYVSLERNMKCGVGWCGHCQLGPVFVCRDGPIFPYSHVRGLLTTREL
jgi:NAD(P)H-flavin reductase